VIFQDFPGPGIFKKTIQDFPELSRRRGNPVLHPVDPHGGLFSETRRRELTG